MRARDRGDCCVDGVELEVDILAAEDEEVGVFGDYSLYDTLAFEPGELGVSFVGSNDVRDILGFQSLFTEQKM